MRRLAPVLMALVLLSGCATQKGGDGCQIDPNPQASGVVLDDPLFLPVYFLYGFGCEGVKALDRHGAFDSPPKGTLQDGVYTAADGSFSVMPPPGDGIHEEYYPQQDYLLFAPRFTKGPVYGMNVSPDQEPIYNSLTLDEFATVELRDARFQTRLADGVPLVEMRREEITLDGRPALSIVYSQTPAGATSPQTYYLLYFTKTRHRSAVLSIAWPRDCPKCATGPEAEMRAMDPALQNFVSSFILVGTGGHD
ncbi:MAG TPA: hypothetical protein VGH91_12285 [Gammaproteobacteria bacterium]|jgi:hypothetical protein